MKPLPDSSKAKIAKRVIEIFEFLADGNDGLSVTDIVTRYGRPQSSTSELLGALREMGLLYRDQESRRFYPSPRLAALGSAGQPEVIANGRLFTFMDRLAKSSRQSVALFGMLGPQLQIYRWTSGIETGGIELSCGDMCPLAASAAGQLLLSTLGEEQSGKVLWRLNAEADVQQKFNLAEARQRVARLGQLGHATGQAGFIKHAQVSAVLLPLDSTSQPLALGVVYDPSTSIDPDAIIETLRFGIGQCLSTEAPAINVAMRTLLAI